MKQNKLLTAGILSALVLGGGVFATQAFAQSSDSQDGLASKIASRFNLDQNEVKSVIGEYRTEHREEHQKEHRQKLEERLGKAVSDGKLTEDQKVKIIEYLSSQESFFENLVDQTREARRDAIKTHREEVNQWAADNGIPKEYVLPPNDGHRKTERRY